MEKTYAQETVDALEWHGWGRYYGDHGHSISSICLLPAGDEPESWGKWVRLPWLDKAGNP